MATASVKHLQQLYIESDMASSELLSLMDAKVAALCRRCPGKVEPNDDSAAVVQTTSGAVVLVVADGVGGCPLGYKASAIASKCVSESVLRVDAGDDLRPAILDGIEHANTEILDLGVGAATTLSVVEIHQDFARAYQVGDSMTLIVGQRGAMKWRSTPHSPVGYAVESGMMNEAEAMHHDERHIVSNLVGSRSMHIEIGPKSPLAARDTVIIGSDGLFDNLHLEEIVAMGKNGPPLKRINQLAELATTRMFANDSTLPGKPDDLTVLLFTR
ncbi:MAG: protein phosphatase 2C domain-containing protein [Pirellulaceae bacterium]